MLRGPKRDAKMTSSKLYNNVAGNKGSQDNDGNKQQLRAMYYRKTNNSNNNNPPEMVQLARESNEF